MIRDSLFKSINHNAKGFSKHMYGQTLDSGYKPDCVLINDNEYIILESENTSSRKTFIGGMMKAAHFLSGEKYGKLVFVMVPMENTKSSSIAKQLKIYLDWIADKTNLREVFVVEANRYYSDGQVLALDSQEFEKAAIKIVANI